MKLFALGTIVRRDKDGAEEVISADTVFDSTGQEANDLRNLGSAREATSDEITASNKLNAAQNGQSAPVESKAKAT